MARLVLVGLPGVGKTTVATALAASWRITSLDTDDLVSAAIGGSPADYLRAEGERAFREHELAALRAAIAVDAVVATGGGVVTTDEGRALLRGELTVWLDCPDDVLLERVRGGDRPLLGDEPAVALAALRAQRAPWYEEVASCRVDASGSPERVAESVRAAASEVAR